jgi:hypothetical protein
MFSSINRCNGKRELYAVRPAVPFFYSWEMLRYGCKKEKTGKKKKERTPEWMKQRRKS